LVDAHVHFMPERVLRKVWAFFDRQGDWPVVYVGDDVERLAILRALGVRVFPALSYAHRPGMARWLSEWGVEFGKRYRGCLPSATFYPEPGVEGYVKDALDAGARVFKVHVQIGDFDPREAVLDPVWGMLAEAGAPVVTHCGTWPRRGRYSGPAVIGEVLARHPRLTLVVAHMGVPEYGESLALADRYANVWLDTTMAFTDYIETGAPYPRDLRPRLADLGDRIVLGSDFPNIPYPYAHQLESLARLDLGDDWLRAVLHHNGAKLFQLP
jgi:predicted TIM-barrel fold metal-dependent hydrolase